MSDESGGVSRQSNTTHDSANRNQASGGARQASQDASKRFAREMYKVKLNEAKRADQLSRTNHKQWVGSLIEKISSREQMSQELLEKQGRTPDGERSSVMVMNSALPKNAALAPTTQEDTELDLAFIDKIVEAVKIRVGREGGQGMLSMDLSTYMPGTECRIVKSDHDCEIEFRVKSAQAGQLVRKHEAALLNRLNTQASSSLVYKLRVTKTSEG